MNTLLNAARLTPLLAALVLTACKPPGPPPAMPALQVTVAHPRVATVTNWDEYPGHLGAIETVELRPRVSGYVDSIHFADGAEVKEGDLLFVIDPRPFQADLDRAKAQRQQAETRLDLSKNDLKRVEALRGTKAISEEEYDGRSKAVREGEAALVAAQAAESAMRINVDYTQIRAPISGRIGRRLVTPGNFVQAQGGGGSGVLATIVKMDPIYCYFDVDERAFLDYRKAGAFSGSSALKCELGLDSEEGFPHQGTIDFFDNQVERQMGTIRLRGIFPNPKRELVPGLFARLRVPAGAPEQNLLIPDVAVGSDQNNRFVFVVNKESQAEVKPVQLGRRHGTDWAVRGGLSPEDRVVVNGLLMLRPGAKVEVTDGMATAAAAPAKQ
jgi:membrane fusion protein, multidrug efflux system